MNLLEKVFGKPSPRQVVKCLHCESNVLVENVTTAPAETCPECNRAALLLEGSSDVFECRVCAFPERQNVRTYFLMRLGRPMSAPELRRVRLPDPPKWDDEAHRKDFEEKMKWYSPASIREKLEARRAELDAADLAARDRIIRRCVDEKCPRYCRDVDRGATTCEACNGELHEVPVVRYCGNPACEFEGREGIVDATGKCRNCGAFASKKLARKVQVQG